MADSFRLVGEDILFLSPGFRSLGAVTSARCDGPLPRVAAAARGHSTILSLTGPRENFILESEWSRVQYR